MNSHTDSSLLSKLITVSEAASITDRSQHTIRRWIREGRIRSVKNHGRVYIPEEEMADVHLRGLGVRTTTQEISQVESEVGHLKAEVGRLKNSLVMVLDELGYGSHVEGLGRQAMVDLSYEAVASLAKSRWQKTELNKWAEMSMRIRDEDIRFGFKKGVSLWRPIYLLLVAQRKAHKVESGTDRILRTKLDRALAHVRSVVFSVSQTVDPESQLSRDLDNAAKEIGALVEPTTKRLLTWIDTVLAA